MAVFCGCSACGCKWPSRAHFLEDPDVTIIGYQVDFDDLTAGTFLFRHTCGATLALVVRHFNGLYEGPIFQQRATGSEEYPRYCLYQDRLDKCAACCECAYVRNLIDIIRKRPKKVSEPASS